MRFRQKTGFFGLSREGWAVIVASLVVGYFAWNAGMLAGTPVGGAYDWADDIINPEVDITVGENMVYPKVEVRETLGAFATSDQIINAYDENGAWLGTATSTGGVATFATLYVQEGSYIWLQARQAAPDAAIPYVMPLERFRVGNGDDGDTVSMYNDAGQGVCWVRAVHATTEPLFKIYAPDGVELTTGYATDNLTTGDTYARFEITNFVDEDCYGSPDFTDMVSGISYKGGIWVVIKTATDSYAFTKGEAREFFTFTDLTYEYYCWNFDTFLWQDSLRTGDVSTFSAYLTLSGTNEFDGGANVFTLDVYDMMLDDGSHAISNFIDGSGINPVEIAFYVD